MKKLVVFLMVSLMASTAFGALDEDPNSMGIYFDDAGLANETAFVGGTVNAYLLLMNPTGTLIEGWEGYFDFTFPAGASVFGQVPVLDGINVSTAPDYVVGFSAPKAVAGPAVVMAVFPVLIFSPSEVVFNLGPAAIPSIPGDQMVFQADGVLQQAGYSTGAPGASAVANGAAPVSVEDQSFGSVKSLFR